MGTGSSRARRTRSCHCSPPRARSGPRWGISSSAPSGQDAAAPRCSPASSPGETDSDAELLDQVLAEFGDDRLAGLAPASCPLPGHPRPARGRGEGDGRHLQRQVLLTGSPPESNNFTSHLPLKKPELQATISYDYSEEELMATIEQEYCR